MLEETKNARVDEWLRVAVFVAKDRIQNAKKAALQDMEKDTEEKKKKAVVPKPLTALPLTVKKNAGQNSKLESQAENVKPKKMRVAHEGGGDEQDEASSSGLMSFVGTRALLAFCESWCIAT